MIHINNNFDLLQQAINNGIINLSSVQKQVEMNKREKILSEHPFTIWIGKDEKWRTYLYDEKKKNNRRLIKRTSKKAIEDAIVEEYKRKEDKCETFRDIFPKWIQYKRIRLFRWGRGRPKKCNLLSFWRVCLWIPKRRNGSS